MAEDELENVVELYCLGDIVHNSMEVQQLYQKVCASTATEHRSTAIAIIRAPRRTPETCIAAEATWNW